MEELRCDGHSKHYVDTLNAVQREAALHFCGPLVVFAGAGSGKTRIITTRIALLIDNGIYPSQILALTFTNKAAAEMKERLIQLSPLTRGCLIATFHSACARWLREFAQHLGFHSDFTIYDDKDSLGAIKLVLEGMTNIDDKYSAQDYLAGIGKAKTYGWLPEDVRQRQESRTIFFPPHCATVYYKYQEALAKNNAMDFNDLLMNMLLLLRSNPQVRETLQKRYRFMMVDEYQDTNPTQFALISELLSAEQNLFVVGDDDQSIYSWRGADPSNILNFKKNFPKAREIKLEQNYRCSGTIVKAASALITKNKYRAAKVLWTENADGGLIEYDLLSDGEMESYAIAERVIAEKSAVPYSQVAIFYRTNAQSRQLEEAMRRLNIPYRIYGSLRFYDRAEVKDIIAYFRLLINPSDDMAFHRIVNVPTRQIGKVAVDAIANAARQQGKSMLEVIPSLLADPDERILARKLSKFSETMDRLRAAHASTALPDLLPTLLGIIEYPDFLLKKHPEQAADKMANIHELGTAISEYAERQEGASLATWLQNVSLREEDGEENGETKESGVTLMTLHSAKGLEFSRVYICGVEDGLIPHNNAINENGGDIEEERRLFYVGLTRAHRKVTLLAAVRRRVYQQWMSNRPSRFLQEIPRELLQTRSPIHAASASGSSGAGKSSYQAPANTGSMRSAAPQGAPFARGSMVFHPTFGKGVIEAVDQSFGAWKAVVSFRTVGQRKIDASFLKQISS
jgi:DNA helicase-2/ATP-dependent DNA helicase PcrA